MKNKRWLFMGVGLLVLISMVFTPLAVVSASKQIDDSPNYSVNSPVSGDKVSGDKVLSSVEPDVIWPRKTALENNQLYLVLRVRTNIEEIAIDMDGESRTQYQYDEIEIKYPVGSDCVTQDDISNYIVEHTNDILELANVQDAWEIINKSDIHNLRDKVKVTKSEAELIKVGKLEQVKSDRKG